MHNVFAVVAGYTFVCVGYVPDGWNISVTHLKLCLATATHNFISIKFNLIQSSSFMLETYIYMYTINYTNGKETCNSLLTSRFHAGHPSIKQNNVSEKLHTSRGRKRDKKTFNHKIVTLMRREKQTNTSIVYVSTQKKGVGKKYLHKSNLDQTICQSIILFVSWTNKKTKTARRA